MVSRHDYLPFGWELYSGLTGRTNGHGYLTSPEGVHTPTQRFTGKERDSETRLDYFGARYYSAGPGRFTSADAPFADQHAADPQSWNLYAYVRNRPTVSVDKDGRAAAAAVLWAIAEISGNVYDAYDTVTTVLDPNASARDKTLSVTGMMLGVMLPGSGYGAVAKAAAKKADDAIDAVRATQKADEGVKAAKYAVTPDGVSVPTDPAELRTNLSKLSETSTKPESSKKFVGGDSKGPIRVRVEKGHPSDPEYKGTPDPLHSQDHLHIDRRTNQNTGPWKSREKLPYEWPFEDNK